MHVLLIFTTPFLNSPGALLANPALESVVGDEDVEGILQCVLTVASLPQVTPAHPPAHAVISTLAAEPVAGATDADRVFHHRSMTAGAIDPSTLPQEGSRLLHAVLQLPMLMGNDDALGDVRAVLAGLRTVEGGFSGDKSKLGAASGAGTGSGSGTGVGIAGEELVTTGHSLRALWLALVCAVQECCWFEPLAR